MRYRGSALDVKEHFEEWRQPSALRSSITHMKLNRVNVAAGAFAFRWFLSIFPIIIALLGFGGLVTLPRHFVVSLIQGVSKSLPSGAAQVLSVAISNATRHSSADLSATIIASVVALWSATSGMVIVEEGLDMAYDIEIDRSFVAKRVVALPLLLGSAVLGGSASALVIFGTRLDLLIKEALPAGSAIAFVWSAFRWVLALALMNLLFSLLYYVAPNRARPKWKWTSTGAVVATLMWALVSLGFSLYTADFGSYAKTYGAFAGVAILIFWLYLTGLALLIGGEINAAGERRQGLRLHEVSGQSTLGEAVGESRPSAGSEVES